MRYEKKHVCPILIQTKYDTFNTHHKCSDPQYKKREIISTKMSLWYFFIIPRFRCMYKIVEDGTHFICHANEMFIDGKL